MKLASLILFASLFPSTNEVVRTKAYQYVHIVDILHPTPLEEIKKKYSAYDSKDGNITNIIEFQTEYNANTCIVSSYELFVLVEDSDGHTSSQTDLIIVRDFIPPKGEQISKEIIINLQDVNIETIFSHFNFVDNLDGQITDIKQFHINGLSFEELSVGTYDFSCYVEDSSTNTSNVIDTKLTIVDSSEVKILDYTLNIKEPILQEDELLNMVLVENILPSNYQKIELQSAYLSSPQKPGIYPVTILIYFENMETERYQFKLNYQQEEKNKSQEHWLWITCSSLLAVVVLGIVIYIKRR